MSLVDRGLRQGWLRPVDHGLADTLRRLRPGTDEAVLLAVALASRALASGHVCLPLAEAGALFADDGIDPPPLPDVAAWHAALAADPHWVGSAEGDTPLVLEGDTVQLRRYWRHEVALATRLRARADEPVPRLSDDDAAWRATRLRALFPLLADDPADAQAAAAAALCDRRLLLLTGGPGTGKTTTVARALLLLCESERRAGRAPPRIALAAPTGKAAARLAESLRDNLATLRAQGVVDDTLAAALPTQATTLHRLLGWTPGAVGFAHDETRPLPFDVVVVDEASMVDLPLMARLVAAVPDTARLLLVGDPDQLPSVEAGDVLGALCGDGSVLPRVALARVHRQAGDSAIAPLAARVRAGDVDGVLSGLADPQAPGLQWSRGGDAALPAAVLAAAIPAYRAIADAADPAEALQRARAFRVLTALRDGPAGSETLNARLAQALAPPAWRGQALFPGALVMVVANSPRHGLFNGDTGVAWPEPSGALRVWFDGEHGPRAWLPASLPANEPAFALTVHKAQGSEFDAVFLVLPAHPARILGRELLYTGLTRARRFVTLWGSEPVVAQAVHVRHRRWSELLNRVR